MILYLIEIEVYDHKGSVEGIVSVSKMDWVESLDVHRDEYCVGINLLVEANLRSLAGHLLDGKGFLFNFDRAFAVLRIGRGECIFSIEIFRYSFVEILDLQ